jgi:hypothetical protein
MSDCPAPTEQNAILMMQFSIIAYDEPTAICDVILNSGIIPQPANTQWKCGGRGLIQDSLTLPAFRGRGTRAFSLASGVHARSFRMRESRMSGFVRGACSDARPYRDPYLSISFRLKSRIPGSLNF